MSRSNPDLLKCRFCGQPCLDDTQFHSHESACPENPDAQDMNKNPDGPPADKAGRC